MNVPQLAPKWTPLGVVQRAARIIRRPADIGLALAIGYFMWRVPAQLRRAHLHDFLLGLRRNRRPPAADVAAGRERILRLRGLWLRLPLFRSRDNCYVRALTLYRFLDAGEHAVSIHFGIEQRSDPQEKLRGHAWVCVDDVFLDGPPEAAGSVIREVPLPAVRAVS